MEFFEFANNLWEAIKPTITLTDNKAVTRSFQSKLNRPALWNACDNVVQFNFIIAHFASSVNTTADCLSRLELKITGEIRPRILEGI